MAIVQESKCQKELDIKPLTSGRN